MKISIVGTGKIVEEVLDMFCREFADRIEVTGILAREHSIEHAVDLCEKYAQKAFVFTDFDRMLAEAEADYVYIANANHVHHAYAKQAILAGKNVIVEKPIAVSRVQTEELFDLALQKCVYCMPAFSLLYMPLYSKIVEQLPRLGVIRMVNCNFAQYSSRYDRYLKGVITPAFDPECHGGALMDLNVYNLCFTIGLFGPPRTCHYMKNVGYNGIDTSGTLMLHYPDFAASLSAAKDSNGTSFACIQGEKGYIEVKGSVSILSEFTLHLNGEEPVTFKAEEGPHRLSYEFDQFTKLLEDRSNCTIQIPFVTRVALEIANAINRIQELI